MTTTTNSERVTDRNERVNARYKPKNVLAWAGRQVFDTFSEYHKLQIMINNGSLYQQDARTQMKVKALIDAGKLKDRPFELNGREVW
jgi:hypothetical protein